MNTLSLRAPDYGLRDLRPEEIESFHRDGAVKVEGVLQAKWVEQLAESVDDVLANPTVLAEATALLGGGAFTGDAFMWKTHDGFRDFMCFSPAARIAEQLFRSHTVTAFYDQIFSKPARSKKKTPFHEDVSSWPIEGDQVCSLWIPLDPCTPTTGALRVVRGSHTWTRRFAPVTPGAEHLAAAAGYEPMPKFRADEIVSWSVVPGDIVIFHPRALHGATGTGDMRRRAFVSRWLGDDVTFQPRHAVLPLVWEHGLQPGERIRGPLFPQILPNAHEEELGARLLSSLPPDAEAADRFVKIMRLL